MEEEHLDERQLKFIALVAKGIKPKDACLAAGYSQSYARRRSHELVRLPVVARELAAIRESVRTTLVYDCAAAMREAKEAMEFAFKTDNAHAYVKAVELRAKLSGLLIDRVEVFSADLRGAIELAQGRVLTILNPKIRAS